MKRFVLKVDSVIGPITAIATGKNLTDALNQLRKDMKGVTSLIAVKSEYESIEL